MKKYLVLTSILLVLLSGLFLYVKYSKKEIVIEKPKVEVQTVSYNHKYLADKDEVWAMLLANYGINKTDDTYVTMKEIEDAEGELNIKNCDLLGLAIKEAMLDQFAIGDNGCSWGVFQINSCVHDVSKRTAFTISTASQWTYDNLISNDYPNKRTYAIARHNGDYNSPKVQAYAFKVMLAAERICNLK
jgi:hypothetical protein